MNVEVVHDPAAASAEWDELARRCAAPPWLRPGWVLAWRAAFAPTASFSLLCARNDGRLTAALPLVGTRARIETPSNSETPFAGALAVDPASASAIAAELFARGHRRITLWPVERGDVTLDACARAGSERGYSSVARVIGRAPYIAIEGDWDDYRKTVGRKVLSEIRRRRRRLAGGGAVTLDVNEGLGDHAALLAEGLRLEAAGWKGSRGTAIAARPPARAFYSSMADWAAREGILRLAFLRLDGRPIAFDLALEDDGVHYLLKTSYDPELRSFGPGSMLRHDMIERAFATRLRRYELLGTDEPWKHTWADRFRDQLLVRFFAPSLTGAVDKAVHSYVKPFGARLLLRLGLRERRGSI